MKPGDMMICDARGIISSIVYGPDQRTRITPKTTRVLFTVYARPGSTRRRCAFIWRTSRRTSWSFRQAPEPRFSKSAAPSEVVRNRRDH